MITLKRPFGRLLHAIGKPHSSPAMIMPERLARTSPTAQVTEMVGSGPFRFKHDEYVSGARMVYEKFADYVPRAEAPAWTSGAKVVNFDRLEWQVIPDPATASAAIQAGEVDWVASILPELAQAVTRNRNVQLFRGDPFGVMAVLRFNHLQPPFDKQAVRQALLKAIDQTPFIQAITARPEDGEACLSMFPCGMPGVMEVGRGVMGTLDVAAARRALAEAGYAGEKVVILNPTDLPSISAHSVLLADLLRRIGLTVDLQDLDWARWSSDAFPGTRWTAAAGASPAPTGRRSRSTTPPRIRPRAAWAIPAGGAGSRMPRRRPRHALAGRRHACRGDALFLAAQRRALETVPTIPLGRTFSDSAIRRDLTGALHGSVHVFWNVRRG